MKISRLLGGSALLVVVGLGGRAHAQVPAEAPEAAPTVGDQGHWSISLERGFGFAYTKESTSLNGVEQSSEHATAFSLFGAPPVTTTSIFTFPRVGIDASLGSGVTVGTALGFDYGSLTQSAAGTTNPSDTFWAFVIAPRIGYAARLSPTVLFWPRAGLSLYYASISPGGTATDVSLRLFAATVDAPFVVTVAPHVAFTFGPTFDITFNGSASTSGSYGGASEDISVLEVGAQAGLVVTL
jgi:hypothetical protein